MKKLKHKKQKNVGLIYEILIKKVTEELINESKDKKAQHLLEKYFNKYTDIYKENKIYQIILSTAGKSYNQISKNIVESLKITKSIDKEKILSEKYNLVGELNETYGEEFFDTTIRNFREFATIFKLIEVKRINNIQLMPGEALILENNLIESLENKYNKKDDNEEYELLESYCSDLDENRKNLVMNLFSLDFNEFKMNLIEEFYAVRENINNVIKDKKIDQILKIKLDEVFKKNKDIINDVKESKEVSDKMLSHLFMLYELETKIEEI